MALLGDIQTWDQTRLAFIHQLQWVMDKRKTKVEKEERSVHEYATKVLKELQRMSTKTRKKEDWTKRGREFGGAMKDLLWILETVDTRVQVDNYPRATYQESLEPRG